VEGILGAAAVGGRMGERIDRPEQLHDGAGPAVGHDQRQRVLMRGADVDEVDVYAVDLGRELRKRVQPRVEAAKVVVPFPVAGELLDRRQLHALRPIRDQLPGGQARGRNSPTQVVNLLFRNLDLERPDLGGCLDGCAHKDLP
jgi:hypothetical protein